MNEAPPVLLVAASGLAREALVIMRAQGTHDAIGFLDDDPALSDASVDGLPVLGPIEAAAKYEYVQLLICAGRGGARDAIVARLERLGISQTRYATIIHPSVQIPTGCTIGEGSILLAGVVLTAAVTIGNHVVVMPHATLTHDCILEDYTTICAGVALGGNVIVQRGAYLGMNASVRERVIVGADATLGMGSVLLRDLPAGETWAGVPADILHYGLNFAPHISFGRA